MSKIALLILGLIAEKPLNPYEIMKLLEKMNVNDIFPMSESSIYATIRALIKKAYITGNKVANGNFPAKTIYNATKTGEAALQEAVERLLVHGAEQLFGVRRGLKPHLPSAPQGRGHRRPAPAPSHHPGLRRSKSGPRRLERSHQNQSHTLYRPDQAQAYNILKFQAELEDHRPDDRQHGKGQGLGSLPGL